MPRAPVKPTPARPAGRYSGVWVSVIVLLTFIAYLPSLGGRFIWNDSDYVTKPALQSWAGLGRIWTEVGATEQYYPLLHSAFWVQHRLWGDHPLGYHLVTILLHAGGAALFGLVLQRLGVRGAWLAALLFALHPVHVESVAWITEQKNTLSLVFYLAAALAYLRFDDTRRPRDYATALGLFALSLLCKTVTASLPAALLVVAWWRRGRLEWRRDVLPLLPWLAVGAGAGLFSSWVEQDFLGAKGEDFELGLLERGLVAGRAIWFYLGKFAWPVGLNFIYPRPMPDASAWAQWLFPAGAAALGAGLWLVRRWNRAPLAAFLLFVGTLFPVLGFVNLYGARYSFVWDHWQYLPDLALCALAAAGLLRLAERAHWPAAAGRGLAAGLLAVLAAMTWSHCGLFHDDETLFRGTLARNPGAWMARFNLGVLLVDSGRIPEGIEAYEETLRLKPDHWKAHTNLGNALLNQPNRLPDAVVHYEAALRLNPNLPEPHYNLGNVIMRTNGRTADALAHYEAAVRLRPDFAAAHLSLADVLAELPGRRPEAIAHYRTAVQADPTLAAAHFNLGLTLLEEPARRAEATAELETAHRLRPDLPPPAEVIRRWRETR